MPTKAAKRRKSSQVLTPRKTQSCACLSHLLSLLQYVIDVVEFFVAMLSSNLPYINKLQCPLVLPTHLQKLYIHHHVRILNWFILNLSYPSSLCNYRFLSPKSVWVSPKVSFIGKILSSFLSRTAVSKAFRISVVSITTSFWYMYC